MNEEQNNQNDSQQIPPATPQPTPATPEHSPATPEHSPQEVAPRAGSPEDPNSYSRAPESAETSESAHPSKSAPPAEPATENWATNEAEPEAPEAVPAESVERDGPHFGIGTVLMHPSFGRGRIQGYEGRSYIILFRGTGVKLVSFDYEGMKIEEREGDPELDRIRCVMEEVLFDYGWRDIETELGSRWHGGSIIIEPGVTGTQAKEIPLEVFFKKIIGVRERLRVLEQKINNNKSMTETEKLELQSYITRSYGSLTTFNVLFADKNSGFKGTGKS